MAQQRLDMLAAEIDREFVASTARSTTLAHPLREASAIVHDSVQSRLLGCAIAIEEAGHNRDPEQFSAALVRALDALETRSPHWAGSRRRPSSRRSDVGRACGRGCAPSPTPWPTM